MTTPKYFHQLCPSPLDLPEIICGIRSHLSISDIKKCTLVCCAWSVQFIPFLWETMHYNRMNLENDPLLERNGHLIRKLFAYSLDNKALRRISRHCPNLTGIELEIEALNDLSSLSALFSSTRRLERLTLRLSNFDALGKIQCVILVSLIHGTLSQLTELRLIGVKSRRYTHIYQTGMILKCLEGCPSLQVLELSGIRIVDTAHQWDEACQSSFSSSNSIAMPSQPAQPAPSVLSWLRWGNRDQSPSDVYVGTAPSRGASIAAPSDTETASILESSSDEVFLPTDGFKHEHLSTLKLTDLYSNANTTTGIAFVSSLLERSPNLQHLKVSAASADFDRLTVLCPKLKSISLENHSRYDRIHRRTRIEAYLCAGPEVLISLRALQLRKYEISNTVLMSIQDEFKRRRLRHLEITNCKTSALNLAIFLGQCESLETLWTDGLLQYEPDHALPPRDRHAVSGPQGSHPQSIRWECSQIRFMNVCGNNEFKSSFDHLLLDMVPRLPMLEFFGMTTAQVGWLMDLEPLRYARPQAPSHSIGDDQHVEDPDSVHGLPSEDQEPLPMDLFISVTTLLIHPTGTLTMEQAKYLCYAFPAMERIVYCTTTFPRATVAYDWPLQTPRRIAVVCMTEEEVRRASCTELQV
ncbi:hypothetical protein BG011_007800 [Mortierella polycephala]|uniref:F-box domain-containing protein n=1 Tax=Mortierella polycephala TaxID=41804 RepID=A0A9P6PR06_9FUNG|nr:hypothetical protein BG011_007800 [Mortierella polycephala]